MDEATVRLRSGRKSVVRPGHPWIYKSQLLRTFDDVKPGSLVTVQDSAGKRIGTGYFNPHSEIAVRILTFTGEHVNGDFIRSRIATAVAKRQPLLGKTNAYRAIFSEADGLPGLIADVYADTLVFQVLTLGMERFKAVVIEALAESIKPKFIYEKSDSLYRKIEGLRYVNAWHGSEGATVVEIREGRAKFLVDIVNGHKTGFYLDQRSSRLALENIAKGKRVLDLFTYTGAFAVHAALYGASRVTGVDIKEDWLELARRNAELNGVAEKAEFVKADSFRFLEKAASDGQAYDIIIVDPPSFIKSKSALVSAAKGYRELNCTAMRCLADKGVLATFSCSHHMPNELFSKTLKEAAAKAGRKLTVLKRCHQAEDHPIVRAIPETEYLKGYFFKVEAAEAA